MQTSVLVFLTHKLVELHVETLSWVVATSDLLSRGILDRLCLGMALQTLRFVYENAVGDSVKTLCKNSSKLKNFILKSLTNVYMLVVAY